MKPFKYSVASDPANAIALLTANEHSKLLGGGTNLVDLMKEDVLHPTELIDVTRLDQSKIEKKSGGISIGSTATNSLTANHELVRENYPLLSMAILAGASAQIRNMATNGGNLNQRTRCTYFYDVSMPCNKREPGSGCGAIGGINKNHAILGWSEKCVATFPSDMSVALMALDASVKVAASNNVTRNVPLADYFRLPGEHPEKDNTLAHGEFITSIEIPSNELAEKSYYLKIRERSSYAFALVSVAAAIATDGNKIKDVRIALGGVAHKPWRAAIAEKMLKGREATEENFKTAAIAELKQAKALTHNKYKISLATNAIVRALDGAMRGGDYGKMELESTSTVKS
ncbi:MAG: xanthine dehydrogenase family protein subunit M [Flavitalea sp.]